MFIQVPFDDYILTDKTYFVLCVKLYPLL